MAEPFPGPGGSLDPHEAADPIAAAAPQRARWPSWTAPALILSGLVRVQGPAWARKGFGQRSTPM